MKTTIFLADLQDFGAVNEIYAPLLRRDAARARDRSGGGSAQGRPGRDRGDRDRRLSSGLLGVDRRRRPRIAAAAPGRRRRPPSSRRSGRRRAPPARRRGPPRCRPAPAGTRPTPTWATSAAASTRPATAARRRASLRVDHVDRFERRAVERRVALGDEGRDPQRQARRDARQLEAEAPQLVDVGRRSRRAGRASCRA